VANFNANQGRKNDFIFLHLVRSNQTNALGFTSNMNRPNVAISKGKVWCHYFGKLLTSSSMKTKGWSGMVQFHRATEKQRCLCPFNGQPYPNLSICWVKNKERCSRYVDFTFLDVPFYI